MRGSLAHGRRNRPRLSHGHGLFAVFDVMFEDLANPIRCRENLSAMAIPHRCRARDTFQLFDDFTRFDPGAQRERDKTADGFRLSGRIAAGLADGREDLAEAVLVFVDRDVEVSFAGLDALGHAVGTLRSSARTL